MIVLGLVLLLVVVAVVVVMVMAGGNPVNIGWDVLNLNWAPTALTVFLLGAATLLVLVIAFAALRTGMRRGSAKRAELNRLRKIESQRTSAAPPAAAPAPVAPPAPQHSATDTTPDTDPYGPGDSKLG